MRLGPGSSLGPYEIIGALGAGGMGEVYRARDPRLGRDIALKVLPPAFADDPARLERFAREARAIAALSHPHIVTIYSTEEADGIRFLTMELVEGAGLDTQIPAGGLPLGRFLSLALPLADALTAAHQKHITHRDLKPANVMVAADGRVKVLDFGLARMETPVGAEDQTLAATRALLTHEGTVVGTMPYMSPEQIEGRPIDARSDLFSLGVMFYEMLAGVRPFDGGSSPVLMSAILRDAPRPLRERRPDVPEVLERLVSRCLEKRPEERVQTARDVYNELRHVQKQLESGSARQSDGSGEVAVPEASFWVAVLPFTAPGGDEGAAALAGGLTEDITQGLARFPALSVVAQHSAQQFEGGTSDVRLVAQRLGARYVLSGQVRKSPAAMRIGVHLVDAQSGAHLWSDTFNRPLDGADLFGLQDEITDRVVATVADRDGVLVRTMGQAVRGVPIERLSTHQLAIWRFAEFNSRPAPDEHARLRAELERRAAAEPHHAGTWAALSYLYCCERSLMFNPLPDPIGRAMAAARRAIELQPTDQHAWEAFAIACFFSRADEEGFGHALERAIQLNARDANTMARMGDLLTHTAQYERGAALTARAMALNPHHPGWYHFSFFNRHIARLEFGEALRAARRVNLPDLHWYHFAVASAAGHLQRRADAVQAVEALDRIAPELADETTLRDVVECWYWEADTVDLLLEGIRLARGMRTDTVSTARTMSDRTAQPAPAASPAPTSPAARAGSGDRLARAAAREISLAVLPLSSRSTDEEMTLIAEDLTEAVVARLSRFTGLRVMSSAAAHRGKGSQGDGRAAGADPGARYLLDGSIRRAGMSVRVSVRLVDAESGAHLWAEQYDRDASAGMFALQDDVADRIAATVGNTSGVLARSMAAALRGRPAGELTVAELVLRYFGYVEQFRPEEHATLREALERLVQREPRAASAWACLAFLYEHEHSHGLNPLPDSAGRQRRAAERAVELDPVDQLAWVALAGALFVARERKGLRAAAERACAINPLHGDHVGFVALLLECAGDTDRAEGLTRDAIGRNPQHPGWYHFVPGTSALRRGDYEEALEHAARINMPMVPYGYFVTAAAAGHLGRVEDARSAFDALARIHPSLADPQRIREQWGRWLWEADLLDRVMDGIGKAQALVAAPGST
jgi:TolB-like protein